jgi:uncharacterized protein YwgA
MNVNEFITFLIDNRLITPNITTDDDEAFNNRLKIQKYVLIARRLGLIDKDYNYDIYIRGPYSSDLADEYYVYEPCKYNIPKEKEKAVDRFLSIVKDKDNNWLEIAGTALHINIRNKELENVEWLTIKAKGYKYPKEKIKEIIKELINYKLLDINN